MQADRQEGDGGFLPSSPQDWSHHFEEGWNRERTSERSSEDLNLNEFLLGTYERRREEWLVRASVHVTGGDRVRCNIG